MKIRIALRAREDIRSAITHLVDQEELPAAVALKDRLFDMIALLASRQFEGPEVQLRSGRVVRTWPVTPFRIYYRRTKDLFEVIRVYHQARRPITK